MCEPSHRFLPGPLSHAPFRVDDFAPGVSLYFLTHAHTDHLRGLSENWCHGQLYCTEVTKRLLLIRFPRFNARLIRVLEVDSSRLILAGKFSLHVTVLDARHCPGSCMFLFESKYIGRILHTGDFRYELDVPLPAALCEADDSETCVYIDNTYGLRTSPSFPSRAEVTKALIDVVRIYPERTRFVFATHGFGKEELIEAVANAIDSNVMVADAEHFAQLNAFGQARFLDRFIPSTLHGENDARVHMVPREDVFHPEKDDDIVVISCSGWCGMEAWEMLRSLNESRDSKLPKTLRVPYSLHSTYAELKHFIRKAKCKYVIPIVHISSCDRDQLGEKLGWKGSTINFWAHLNVETVDEECDAVLAHNEMRKSVTRIAASPTSHEKRLKKHRTRILKHSHNNVVQLIVSRDNRADPWSEEEERILLDLRERRLALDELGHAESRRKLRRSDGEIFLKLAVLESKVKNQSRDTSFIADLEPDSG